MSIYYDVVDSFRNEAVKGDIGLDKKQKERIANILRMLAIEMVLDNTSNNEKYPVFNKLLHIIIDDTIGLSKLVNWLNEYSDEDIFRRVKHYKSVKEFVESSTEDKLKLSKDFNFKPDYVLELIQIENSISNMDIKSESVTQNTSSIRVAIERFTSRLSAIKELLNSERNPYMDTVSKNKYINLHTNLTSYLSSVA